MSDSKGHLFYEMQRLTSIAEDLVAHVEAMRDHAAAIMTYCTGECHECPIRKICDWDRNIAYEDTRATDIETMVDFVDYSHDQDRRLDEEEMIDYTPYDGWEREADNE